MKHSRLTRELYCFWTLLFIIHTNFVHAENIPAGPVWFHFADPKINEMATQAVDELSEGIVQLITALNSGRKTGNVINFENSKQALVLFSQAADNFEKISNFIGARKIDAQVIERSGNLPAYYDLVESLKKAGYAPPTNGKELMLLLKNICNKESNDIEILMKFAYNPKSTPFKDFESATFDLILQKILMEKLGAAMNILTISMQ